MIKELYIKSSKYKAIKESNQPIASDFSWARLCLSLFVFIYLVASYLYRYEIFNFVGNPEVTDPSGIALFAGIFFFTAYCLLVCMLSLAILIGISGVLIGLYFWIFKGSDFYFFGMPPW